MPTSLQPDRPDIVTLPGPAWKKLKERLNLDIERIGHRSRLRRSGSVAHPKRSLNSMGLWIALANRERCDEWLPHHWIAVFGLKLSLLGVGIGPGEVVGSGTTGQRQR